MTVTTDNFVAIWTASPWGVLYFGSDDVKLYRGGEWLRHLGGMPAHYREKREGRTISVDTLLFDPRQRGLRFGRDALGRETLTVDLGMIHLLAMNDDGVDARYFAKAFEPDQVERIVDALDIGYHRFHKLELPPKLALAAREMRI